MLQNYEQSFCLPSEIDFCSNGYMTADQIQSLLPPIVLSLGAILPFLVASPPFAVAANARVLLICVMTLVIWLGYWTAYAFGSWAFASLTLTVVLIIVALLLFIVIFSVAQRAPTPKKNADGTQIMNSEGKPVMNAAIDQPGWLWVYLMGLLAVSVAAALYVGPKDWVMVEFELPKDSSKSAREIKNISKVIGAGSPSVTLELIGHGEDITIMLPKTEFDAVERFLVRVDTTPPTGGSPTSSQLDAFPGNKGELLRPGLGKHYRIPAQP